jgi:hypothetical protein
MGTARFSASYPDRACVMRGCGGGGSSWPHQSLERRAGPLTSAMHAAEDSGPDLHRAAMPSCRVHVKGALEGAALEAPPPSLPSPDEARGDRGLQQGRKGLEGWFQWGKRFQRQWVPWCNAGPAQLCAGMEGWRMAPTPLVPRPQVPRPSLLSMPSVGAWAWSFDAHAHPGKARCDSRMVPRNFQGDSRSWSSVDGRVGR